MPMKLMTGARAALILVALVALAALTVGGALAQAPAPSPTPLPDPTPGSLDREAAAAVDLAALPVIPEINEHARAIYQDALDHGRSPHSFAKVGDCMTHNPYFLLPIGAGEYDLGDYPELAPVIAHYQQGEPDPFARVSEAAAGGFNAASVLDALWANPEQCAPGETPLACEFRAMQPSVALIMFGTNDVQTLDEAQFDYFLRSTVVETLRQHVLPVLSTFPQRPEYPEKALLFNQIVARVAQDYDVPLINLWRALDPLPNQGVDPQDTTHLTTPADGALVCAFVGPNLEAGFTVRNLVTLQTLGALMEKVDGEQ